jgi:hypothetical protein
MCPPPAIFLYCEGTNGRRRVGPRVESQRGQLCAPYLNIIREQSRPVNVSRLSVVTPLCVLCAIALMDAGCRVYDTELLQNRAVIGLSTAGTPARTDAVSLAAASDAAAAMLERALPVCGNGRVDEAERCDVAIAQGQPGACPDGCNAHDGCFAERLDGRRCGARCVAKEITQAIADDGCCPNGATPETDSDCSATCGNSLLESGETCDPPQRCPELGSCRTELTCMSARFTGAPATCSARCELVPIVSCVNGDHCCPSGCTSQEDDDCIAGVRRPATATQQTPGAASGASSAGAAANAAGSVAVDAGVPAELPRPGCTDDCDADSSMTRCTEVHAAGACEVCDCAYCADQVVDCEAQASESARDACRALLQCATKNSCAGLDCYCGSYATNACASGWSNGPCMAEVRKVAGTSDAISIFLQAFSGEGPLLYAANALSCRGQHCRRACGL